MKLGKKAIAMYISVILVLSIIITFLFLGVLGTIYSEENPLCSEIDFFIENTCALRDGVQVSIRNSAEYKLDILINGLNVQTLSSKEIKVFKFDTKDEKSIAISPVVQVYDKIVSCNSKNKVIDSNLITTNCR